MNEQKKGKFKTHVQAYRNDAPTLTDFFEGFFYEVKPFLYISFCVWAWHSHYTEAWWVKICCMGIMLFGFLTLFSRLSFRGYLE